jgi:hypothetical protein
VLVAALLLALAGCATRGPVDDQKVVEQLGFLRIGATSRAEVESRLGPPAHVYEGGRVVTYVLIEEQGGRLKTTAYAPYSGYTLVIEYAADGKLARRALVRRVKGGT